MVRKILIWSGILMVLALLLLFFINGGGYRAIVNSGLSIHRLPTLTEVLLGTAASSSQYRLPGQDKALSGLGIDPNAIYSGDSQLQPQDGQSYQAPPSSQVSNASPVQTYGNPSPDAGRISLDATNAYASTPTEEYVTLIASQNNAGAIDISGWSLQSMLSGVRLGIPLAASPYVLGVVNHVSDVLLAPGASATVVSGISPVGVSFKETLCTGYLNQMQSFTPALANSCPAKDRILPYTQENLARYGASCFDFLSSLPQCDFPTGVPNSLSTNCRNLLYTAFSYNGCVNTFQNAPDFALASWRLYGSFTREIWSNTHDTIRLLDREGRTVDSVSY